MGYTVQETKVVLREELRGKAQVELDAIRASQGKSALLTSETKDLLTFTGDTPIVDASVWGRPLVLIHEATFLDEETASANRTNRHSHLAAVIDVALSVAPQALVLTHFSSRYEKEQIVTRLTAEASSRRVPFPIWMIGPAELVRDVFRTAPAWQP